VNCVVATQSFLLGEFGDARHELSCHRHDVEIAHQRLELSDRGAVLRLGETPKPSGGSERSARLDHDEAHRRNRVGGGPDGHGALGTVLVDDQLEQRRGIDVGDHPDRPDRQRRCSATRSLTVPFDLIRTVRRFPGGHSRVAVRDYRVGLPTISGRGTIVTMTTDSLRNVKDRFSEFVDRVDREHERIVVTRNGRPAAVLISPDDLDSLEETLELLGDHVAVRELVEAEAAVASGDVVRGVDAVRALRTSPGS
jgi:prevent-host-death family protein